MERKVIYEQVKGKDHPFLELLHCLYGLVGFLCFMLSPLPCFMNRPDITLIMLIITYTVVYTFDKIDIEKSITIKEVLNIKYKQEVDNEI